MTDSSYDEDDREQEIHHDQHPISHQALSQRLGAMKFPSKFKKAVSRERVNSRDEQYHDKDKSTSPSLQSISTSLKQRFNPSFLNRMRTGSDPMSSNSNIANTNSNNSNGSIGSFHSHRTPSPKHNRPKKRSQPRRASTSMASFHQRSPTPPSQSSHHSENMNHRHLDSLIAENRVLKDEVNIWRERVETVQIDKDSLLEKHETLKEAVTDMTAQLRIMTRKYDKMRSKNEEYREHYNSTLSVQMSKQQDTIRNYHHQLESIRGKYERLMEMYRQKGDIVEEWKTKYERLTRDFDSYVSGQDPQRNGGSNGKRHRDRLRPSELAQRCKLLEQRVATKDETLEHMASIIGGMYKEVYPLISDHLKNIEDRLDARRRGVHGSEDDAESEEDSSSEEEEEERTPRRDRNNRNDRNDRNDRVDRITNQISNLMTDRRNEHNRDNADSRFLRVQRESKTPHNSYDDDVAADERSPITPQFYISPQEMYGVSQAARIDSHMNDNDDGTDHEQGSMADSDDEHRHHEQHFGHKLQLERGQKSRGSHRNVTDRVMDSRKDRVPDHLSVTVMNTAAVSDISCDDDGIDERDDDELTLDPITFKKRKSASLSSKSGLESPVSNLSANGNDPVTSPTVSKLSSTSTTTKKKRRRSWVMDAQKGPILVTTDGDVSALQTSHSEPTKDSKRRVNEDYKMDTVPSGGSNASPSDSFQNVAPSPAPPPPSSVVFQKDRKTRKVVNE